MARVQKKTTGNHKLMLHFEKEGFKPAICNGWGMVVKTRVLVELLHLGLLWAQVYFNTVPWAAKLFCTGNFCPKGHFARSKGC